MMPKYNAMAFGIGFGTAYGSVNVYETIMEIDGKNLSVVAVKANVSGFAVTSPMTALDELSVDGVSDEQLEAINKRFEEKVEKWNDTGLIVDFIVDEPEIYDIIMGGYYYYMGGYY